MEILSKAKNLIDSDFASKGLKHKACRIAIGLGLASSAINGNWLNDDLNDGEIFEAGLESLYLGTELVGTAGLTALHIRARRKDDLTASLQEETQGRELQAGEIFYPLQQGSNR